MTDRICSIDGCSRPHLAKALCSMHYQRATDGIDMARPPRITLYHSGSPEERFWQKVDKDGPVPAYAPELGPCWIWRGPPEKDGYGRLGVNGKTVKAHRFAYELLAGPIPEGLVPDHLCRVPRCVKATADNLGPSHLEVVTGRENTLRGISPSAINAAKTRCRHGHAFTPENNYMKPDGTRGCRICRQAAVDRYRARIAARST